MTCFCSNKKIDTLLHSDDLDEVKQGIDMYLKRRGPQLPRCCHVYIGHEFYTICRKTIQCRNIEKYKLLALMPTSSFEYKLLHELLSRIDPLESKPEVSLDLAKLLYNSVTSYGITRTGPHMYLIQAAKTWRKEFVRWLIVCHKLPLDEYWYYFWQPARECKTESGELHSFTQEIIPLTLEITGKHFLFTTVGANSLVESQFVSWCLQNVPTVYFDQDTFRQCLSSTYHLLTTFDSRSTFFGGSRGSRSDDDVHKQYALDNILTHYVYLVSKRDKEVLGFFRRQINFHEQKLDEKVGQATLGIQEAMNCPSDISFLVLTYR